MLIIIKKIVKRIVNLAFDRFISVDDQTIIGQYTYIGQYSSITKSKIGNYCSIGSGVLIGLGEHLLDGASTSAEFYHGDVFSELTRADVVVDHDVWIGANAIILRGVHIGTGAVIGAGAVVTKDIPPYAIAVGVPAVIIRYRLEPLIREKLLASEWWLLNKNDAKKIHNKLMK